MVKKEEKNSHLLALKRLERAFFAQEKIRERAQEITNFVRTEGAQWDMRTATGEKLCDKVKHIPKIEINKLARKIQQINSEYQRNRISVKFKRGDKSATDELANKLNGIFRYDFNNSQGEIACDNAFDDAITGGFGCFALKTESVNPFDNSDLQKVVFEPIFEPINTVFFDVAATEYDKSDAKYAFRLFTVDEDEYESEYKRRVSELNLPTEFTNNIKWHDEASGIVYIAKYYEVKDEYVQLIQFKNDITTETVIYEADEIESIYEELIAIGFEEVSRFRKKKRRVYVSVIDSQGFLEKPQLIHGEHIPLIPVYGLRNIVNGIENFKGCVNNAVDAQILFNFQVSSLLSTAVLNNNPRPIIDAEHVEPYSDVWENRETDNPSYLPLASKTINGNEIPPTIVGYTPTPTPNPATVALIQQTDNDIRDVTGANLANQAIPSNIANETVGKIFGREDDASYVFIANMARSIKRAGVIWLSITREICGADREVIMVDEEGEEKFITIFTEIIDEETGKKVAVNDLSTGIYNVEVDVGLSHSSKREATVDKITKVLPFLQTDPQTQAAAVGILIDNLDGEGLDDFKRFNRDKMLIAGIVEPKDDAEKKKVFAAQQAAAQRKDPAMLAMEIEQKTAEANLLSAKTKAFVAGADVVKKATESDLNQAKTAEIKTSMNQSNFEKIITMQQQASNQIGQSLAGTQNEEDLNERQ